MCRAELRKVFHIIRKTAHLKCSPTDSLENSPTRMSIRMPSSSTAGNTDPAGACLSILLALEGEADDEGDADGDDDGEGVVVVTSLSEVSRRG